MGNGKVWNEAKQANNSLLWWVALLQMDIYTNDRHCVEKVLQEVFNC